MYYRLDFISCNMLLLISKTIKFIFIVEPRNQLKWFGQMHTMSCCAGRSSVLMFLLAQRREQQHRVQVDDGG